MDQLGVIFDMDGVLVDSYQPHYESWRRTARKRGLDMTEAQFAQTFGRTSREIIRHFWPGRFSDEQVAAWDAEKEAVYRDIIAEDFPEMDGATGLLAALKSAGFALAIGSSGPRRNVQVVLQHLTNAQLFDATVDGSEVTEGKPNPDVFLKAATKLSLPPRSCAVIEDSVSGIQAARRAGMAAVALTGTIPRDILEAQADAVVDSLRELSPAAIAELIQRHCSTAQSGA